MKVRDVMTRKVICVRDHETVDVAARTLEQYSIGAMPVCGSGGSLRGMITDRDLVTRCIAANRDPSKTTVGQIMTNRLSCVSPEDALEDAAQIMGAKQIRRLPVVENGRLCGIVSLKDLADRGDSAGAAAGALREISG